jgi:hypothetical protein
MKKNVTNRIILLSVFITLNISCDKSDNNNTKELRTVNLNPPEWIIGTWLDEDRDYDSGWSFSGNDVIYINKCNDCSGESLIDRAEYILNSAGNESSYVDEIITENYYKVFIYRNDRSGSFQEEYSFFKRPNNQIEWTPTPPGVGLLSKQ